MIDESIKAKQPKKVKTKPKFSGSDQCPLGVTQTLWADSDSGVHIAAPPT